MMSHGRKQMPFLIFLIVQDNIVHTSFVHQLITGIHLDTERAEHSLCSRRLLDNRIVQLFLRIARIRKNSEIMMEQTRIGTEFHHLRVNEHELQF